MPQKASSSSPETAQGGGKPLTRPCRVLDWEEHGKRPSQGARVPLPAVSKLGPVHTAGHPLMKPQSPAKIFSSPSRFIHSKFQNQTHKKYKQKLPRLCVLELLLRDSDSKNLANEKSRRVGGGLKYYLSTPLLRVSLLAVHRSLCERRLLTASRSHHGDAQEQRL